jgi:hypothetical protein
MANVNEMREYFEKILDEHGFDPVNYDYRIVHHEVASDGDPHKHTHLFVIPKKGIDDDISN